MKVLHFISYLFAEIISYESLEKKRESKFEAAT